LPGWGYPQISKYIDIIKVGQCSTKVVTTQWSAQPISKAFLDDYCLIAEILLSSQQQHSLALTKILILHDRIENSDFKGWREPDKLQEIKQQGVNHRKMLGFYIRQTDRGSHLHHICEVVESNTGNIIGNGDVPRQLIFRQVHALKLCQTPNPCRDWTFKRIPTQVPAPMMIT
jgi:hypothetical protein